MKHFYPRLKNSGFSLIELLVCLGVVAMLVSMLMPALQRARHNAMQTRCLSNIHQLTVAWGAYPSDHNNKIVNGMPDDNDGWVKQGAGRTPIELGKLFSYVNRFDVWRCEADQTGNTRSYSIAAPMHGEKWDAHLINTNDPLVQYGTDEFLEIINPSKQLVMLEELDARGWNAGSWIMYARSSKQYQWIDYMATFHGNGTVMGFADGHVDYWHWRDKDTLYASFNSQLFLNDQGNEDWMRVRNVYRSLLSRADVPELINP
ncbi:MAG: type II secretion system protein [Phycisphaeraceae bacterium]|nr:type II secretion system protein [Phycisphaeraceae bacterium]